MAILGELPAQSGSASTSGASIAYVSQNPFLMTGSIRDNITFGLPFEGGRYAAAVEACALTTDLAGFPDGR